MSLWRIKMLAVWAYLTEFSGKSKKVIFVKLLECFLTCTRDAYVFLKWLQRIMVKIYLRLIQQESSVRCLMTVLDQLCLHLRRKFFGFFVFNPFHLFALPLFIFPLSWQYDSKRSTFAYTYNITEQLFSRKLNLHCYKRTILGWWYRKRWQEG